MKKKLALILIVALLLGLTGCGMSRPVTQEEIDAIWLGTVENGVYENTCFGVGCAPGEPWQIMAEEEVLALNEWSAEEDLTEQMKKSLGKPGYFYEMMAELEDQSASIGVCVENVAVLEDPDATPQDYIRSAVVSAREALSTIEVPGAIVEQVQMQVAGQECYGYTISFENEGNTLYQKSMYLHSGIYVLVITVSCVGEDITDRLLDMFYPV